MSFDELKFDEIWPGHMQAKVFFANGYGASIVCGPHTYGGPKLYEMAVLYDGVLCYDSGITEDVIGWLTPDEVVFHLAQIENLEKR